MKKITIKPKQAFSLVELVIVVGIVILVVALSINGFIRSRINANEAAAVKTMETLHAAFSSYRFSNSAYPEELVDLTLGNPPHISEDVFVDFGGLFDSGKRRGYEFVVVDSDSDTFGIYAFPSLTGVTGNSGFYIDESGEIIKLEAQETVGIEQGGPDPG